MEPLVDGPVDLTCHANSERGGSVTQQYCDRGWSPWYGPVDLSCHSNSERGGSVTPQYCDRGWNTWYGPVVLSCHANRERGGSVIPQYCDRGWNPWSGSVVPRSQANNDRGGTVTPQLCLPSSELMVARSPAILASMANGTGDKLSPMWRDLRGSGLVCKALEENERFETCLCQLPYKDYPGKFQECVLCHNGPYRSLAMHGPHCPASQH